MNTEQTFGPGQFWVQTSSGNIAVKSKDTVEFLDLNPGTTPAHAQCLLFCNEVAVAMPVTQSWSEHWGEHLRNM